MENALEVSGLCKKYDGFSLNDVSFDLPKGSIMGFIGENGAGKTTTLKLLLNIIQKDSGKVRIFDMDHIEHEKQIKQRIGVVMDDNHFHENLRPANISSMMKYIYENWDDALFVKNLKRFGVPPKKTVKQMSKGMKTKLSLSVALSHNPQILILDEATSGLDPVMRNEILDIFLDIIQDDERAVLLSTHIISDLERIADYITLIQNGQIVFSKSADDLRYGYGVLKCGQHDYQKLDPLEIVGHRKGRFGIEALVRDKSSMQKKYPHLTIDPVHIEDIMLFYVRSDNKQ